MMIKEIKIAFSFLLLFIIASACNTQKRGYKSPIKEEGADYLLSQMKINENHFETFSAKALASFTSHGKTNDVKLNIRIRKDSAIWVSISAGVGIEAARVLLTRDSVLFLNRLNKTFFAGNYQFINKMINAQVDFDIVQAILTGNDFTWYDYQELKATVVQDQYQLESAHRRKMKKHIKANDVVSQVIYQSLWLNPLSFKIEKLKIKEIKNDNKKIVAEYDDFKEVDGQILPTQYNLTISANEVIEIDATLIKVNLEKELSFPFNIPSKYTEIK